MDVIRCSRCRFAEQLEGEGALVCKVREGVGGFYVPDDGFCHLAEERSDGGRCGECAHYRRHKHYYKGSTFSGVCCKHETVAFSMMENRAACAYFEKR